jgi:hypothetical protein
MADCAYIFLDEAGNFDFSRNGTKYFLLTSVSLRRPFHVCTALDACKHDCLEHRLLDTDHFHCAKDTHRVRGAVFDLIATHLDSMRIDCLVVEKRKTGPALREDRLFYPEMLGYLLKFVLPRELDSGAEEMIVITDTIPLNKKRQAIEKGVQLALARMLPPGMKHRILHHESRSHYGLQVADYCCWAVHRKLHTGETTYYSKIPPAPHQGDQFGTLRSGKCACSNHAANAESKTPPDASRFSHSQ